MTPEQVARRNSKRQERKNQLSNSEKEELKKINRIREKSPKRRQYKREKQKERRHRDLAYKLRNDISREISMMLRSMGTSKHGQSILNYLEWTFEELIEHLTKLFSAPENLTPDGQVWMNERNHAKYIANLWNDIDPSTWVWNLDHIIPQSELPYYSMNDDNFKKCWALSNLRPLSGKINIIDGVLRTRHTK